MGTLSSKIRDLNIDHKKRDYDFCHNRVALMVFNCSDHESQNIFICIKNVFQSCSQENKNETGWFINFKNLYNFFAKEKEHLYN